MLSIISALNVAILVNSLYLPTVSSRSIITARQASRGNYNFDAASSSNVAVYFGRTDETVNTNLTAQCSDKNVDIVILAFVTDILGIGNYPNMAFDNLCSGQTDTMRSSGATGLLSCIDLAPQIETCQSLGKKVLLGIGGQHGNSTFASTAQADAGAKKLWDLFAGGSGEDAALRPFGSVVVDGFDVDNETGDGDFYQGFVTTIRSYFNTQRDKKYYLSAAPTCYLGDDSQHSYLNLMDFVWPQFYAAPSCNIGSENFQKSVVNWSARLSGPKLFIGSPAWAEGTANGGYEEHSAFAKTVQEAKKSVGNKKFGGVMLWDGAYGHLNKNSDGKDYIETTKEALKSRASMISISKLHVLVSCLVMTLFL